MKARNIRSRLNSHYSVFSLPGFSSQANTSAASTAPMNSAAINAGTSIGRMPEKVSVNPRAMATAGLAKDVDDVNQYPAVINSPTA